MPAGGRREAPELSSFAARHAPEATERVVWAGGTMPIEIAYYVTEEPAPETYVTSVRAVVTSGRSCSS